MSDDIDAFLRRAAERRKAAAGGGKNAPQQPSQPPPPPPQAPTPTIARPFESSVGSQSLSSAQPSKPLRPQQPTKRQRPNKQGNKAGSLAAQRPQNNAEYDPAKVAVDQADERMEAHLQSTFEHRVGNLTQSSASSPLLDNGTVTAQSLLNLLRQPGGIQSAILLREILDRPVHRWQKPNP